MWMWTLKCELRSIQDRSKWVWTLSFSKRTEIDLRSIQLRLILVWTALRDLGATKYVCNIYNVLRALARIPICWVANIYKQNIFYWILFILLNGSAHVFPQPCHNRTLTWQDVLSLAFLTKTMRMEFSRSRVQLLP